MKESDVVARIHEEVKKQLPRCVYLKLNDMSTTGIPDLALTYVGTTIFVEVKFLRQGETPAQFKKHFSGLQLATCRLLQQQGHCIYFIAYKQNDNTYALLMRPHKLALLLDKGAKEVSDLLTVTESGRPLLAAIAQLIERIR